MATNVSVRGTITNSSHGDLHLPHDFPNHHDWSGHVEGSYPNIIPLDAKRTFTHRGEGPDGSVAAVIYSGKSSAHASGDDCGWLLAWQVKSEPGNNSNKVRPSSVISTLTFFIGHLLLTLVNLYN